MSTGVTEDGAYKRCPDGTVIMSSANGLIGLHLSTGSNPEQVFKDH